MATENIRNVTYKNLGWDSSADIYLLPGFGEKKKYPALVSTHPIGSCKEQTAGNVYGAALARKALSSSPSMLVFKARAVVLRASSKIRR